VATVTINGEAVKIEAETTVLALVAARTGREQPIGIAVACNGVVLPRSQWAARIVQDGDEYELVGVMQGG